MKLSELQSSQFYVLVELNDAVEIEFSFLIYLTIKILLMLYN